MADIIPKNEIPLNSEQEMTLLECVRAGMDPYEVCWNMKFHPGRMVRHLRAQPEFYQAFKQAEAEGKEIDKFELYLALLRNGRKNRVALRLSGLTGWIVEQRRREDDKFDLEVKEAEAEAHEALETEAYRRAVDGSDVLVMFLLKAGDPVKYRETQRKVDQKDEVEGDDIDRLERGKRIAFALQLAARGRAANDQPRDGQDPGKPAVDPPDRASN